MNLSSLWIILFVLCIGKSDQQLFDWFNDNTTENNNPLSSSTVKNWRQPTRSHVIRSTSETTSSTSTPSTTTTTTLPSTSPTTPSTPSRSTKIPSTPSIKQFIPTDGPISFTKENKPSTDLPLTTIKNQLKDCLLIELNAKITFKYKSSEGYDQQFEVIGGTDNGELLQNNRCQREQKVIVKYDQMEHSKLVLSIAFNEIQFKVRRIKFEYPSNRLPKDYNKTNNQNNFQSCSKISDSGSSSSEKCLIASKDNINELSMKLERDDQIYCKRLPLIELKIDNKDESIELLIKNFHLGITKDGTKTFDPSVKKICPFVTDWHEASWYAGTNKIWIAIGASIAGAIIMFGFVFLYEKFVRDRFWYYLVNDNQDNNQESQT